MFCPNCGKDVGGSRFCPSCGSPVQSSPNQSEQTGILVIRKETLNTLAGVGADVYVDGQFKSTLDSKNRLALRLPVGPHDVSIQIDDYADASANVFIDYNSTCTYILAVDERNKMTQLAEWKDPHEPTYTQPNSYTPVNRSVDQSNGMVCPRCGKANVSVQVVQENHGGATVTKSKGTMKEKRHGLFWWLFIGWWWWAVDLCLWIFVFPLRLVAQLFKKRDYKTNSTSVAVTSNRITYKKICTCQNCGNSWSI